MSKSNVRAFWQKVEEDPALKEQLSSIPDGNREVMMAGLVRIAAERGFPFSAEEFVETADLDGVPLSDDDLDGIAGGLVGPSDASMSTFRLPTKFGGFRFRGSGGL